MRGVSRPETGSKNVAKQSVLSASVRKRREEEKQFIKSNTGRGRK